MTKEQLFKLLDILDAHDEKAHRDYLAMRESLLTQVKQIQDREQAMVEHAGMGG